MGLFKNKVVYISGPITGVEKYWEAFETAENFIERMGGTALNPSRLPQGLTNAQYIKIDLAQIDAADLVYFIKGWEDSKGATLEHAYCNYTGKAVWYE